MAPSGPDASNSCLPPTSPVIVSSPPVPSASRGERCVLDGKGGRINKDKALLAYHSGKLVVTRELDDQPLLPDSSTCPLPVLTYRGHHYPVTALKLAPSGAYMASGDERGMLRVWAFDHEEHLCKYSNPGLTGPIRDLDWDHESKRIVLGGERGSDTRSECARVLQWDTGVTVGQLAQHLKGRVATVAFKPNRPYRIVTGGKDDTKTYFHKGPPFQKIPPAGGIPADMSHSKGAVSCVRYNSTGTLVVSFRPTTLDPLIRRLEQLQLSSEHGTTSSNSSSHPLNEHEQEPDRKKARLLDDGNDAPEGMDSNKSSVKDYDEEEEEEDNEAAHSHRHNHSNHGDDSNVEEEQEQEVEPRNDDRADSPALDLDAMDDNTLLQLLRSVASARGIPLSLLVEGHVDDEDDEDIDYPFDELPTNLQQIADFIQSDQCRRILVLAGAGMSVPAGIPDYRSADGFYANLNVEKITASPEEQQAIRLDPTVALQQPLFLQNPLPCLELKRDFILGTYEQRWKATLAHRFVELLHRKTNKLVRLYTQNIDGLEDQCEDLVDTDKVIPVHGSMDRAECASCGAAATDFDAFCRAVQNQIKDVTEQDATAPAQSRPIECTACGQPTMKPAIVLFRSSLPRVFFDSVPDDVQDVDLLIVLGTSLQVAPANSLVWRVPRSCLRVLINREAVGQPLGMQFSPEARRDYHAEGDCEQVVLDLMEHLGWLPELEPLLSNDKLPESSARLLRERLLHSSGESSNNNNKNENSPPPPPSSSLR